MAVLLWGLLGLVALLLAALVLLLATPVHFRFLVERPEGGNSRFAAEIRVLGGLAPALRIGGDDGSAADKPAAKPAEAPAEGARAERPRAVRKMRMRKRRGLPGGKGVARRMIRALPGLVRGELRRIHVDRLSVDADFGLDDPAETGRLYGWVTPLIYGIRSPRIALGLRPDFTGPRLSGRAEAAMHLTPAALLGPVISFAWTVFVVRR